MSEGARWSKQPFFRNQVNLSVSSESLAVKARLPGVVKIGAGLRSQVLFLSAQLDCAADKF